MIKLLLSSVCFGFIGLSVITSAYAANDVDKGFEEQLKAISTPAKVNYVQKAPNAKEVVVVKADNTYKTDLINALMFHNFMNSIKGQYAQLERFRLAVLDKEISNAKVKDFDTCNVGLLSSYFAKPKQVWDKLKAETDEKIEDYNLNTVARAENLTVDEAQLLASADDTKKTLQAEQGKIKLTKEAQEQMAILDNAGFSVTESARAKINVSNESSAELAAVESSWETNEDVNLSELAPEIDITFSILNLFYPHQDEWGARKSKKTSSLPLWEDQKFLYNRDVWAPKYRAIREHCKAQKVSLALKEPKVSDAIKYDYYFYDDVKSAHSAFVNAAQAQKCVLTSEMKEPPQVAPRPLPPVYEEIIVMKDESDNLEAIYPQNPMNPSAEKGNTVSFIPETLWEEYKKEGYKDIASEGEFDTYFKVDNSTLRARSVVNEIDGNRLSKYLLYKEEAANALETYEGFLDAGSQMKQNIEGIAKQVGIDLPEGLNFLDEKDLDTIYNILKTEKEKALEKIANRMGDKVKNVSSMTAEELRKDIDVAYYNALMTDTEAEVKLTEENAVTIEDAIKEARANQELVDLMGKTANERKLETLQAKNFKANAENCLRMTETRLVDINKVKIK